MKKFACVLASIALTSISPGFASDQVGAVIAVGGDTGNPFTFRMNGTRTLRPACATDGNYVFPWQSLKMRGDGRRAG
jgi:hypothetical protein